ncbi:oligosaccharide flippase family protein [Lactococcus petauri]
MLVSLYTSRIVLQALGVEDFGIYNVVGGAVTMFSFFNGAMAAGTQRFLSFELGKTDSSNYQKVFSLALVTHAGIAVLILILAETVGLWFLNTKMNIPVERMDAARWIFHFSAISLFVNVLQVPYSASIIAHEMMSFFAYISILEVSLKLLMVFLLAWVEFDKLKLFAVLTFLVTIVISVIYRNFCKKKFSVCQFKLVWDKPMLLSLVSFAGWNLFGNLAWMAMGQGVNILLNIFFGPAVNAARGIAFQVNSSVMTFVSNFRVAVNPQIVKSCAAGEKDYMNELVFESAKYSYYLLLLFSLPLILETKIILELWLTTVPDHAILFCRLALINSLVVSFDGSFLTVFQAYDRVKENQILSGVTYLMILPVSYFCLQKFPLPEIVFYLQILSSFFVAFVIKLGLMIKIVGITVPYYLKNLIIPTFKVTVISLLMPLGVYYYFEAGFWRFVLICLISLISVFYAIFYFGIKDSLRERIFSYIERSLFQILENKRN